jgi:hypothetical protein
MAQVFNTLGESGRVMIGLLERAEVGALIGELTMTLALLAARRRPIRMAGDAFRITGDEGADRPDVLLVGVERDSDNVRLEDWLSSMGILCCGLG